MGSRHVIRLRSWGDRERVRSCLHPKLISTADWSFKFFVCSSGSDDDSDEDREFWDWPKLSCTVGEHSGEVRWPMVLGAVCRLVSEDLKTPTRIDKKQSLLRPITDIVWSWQSHPDSKVAGKGSGASADFWKAYPIGKRQWTHATCVRKPLLGKLRCSGGVFSSSSFNPFMCIPTVFQLIQLCCYSNIEDHNIIVFSVWASFDHE